MDQLGEHMLQAIESIALTSLERRELAIVEEQNILSAELKSLLHMHDPDSSICTTVRSMLRTLCRHAEQMHMETTGEFSRWEEETPLSGMVKRATSDRLKERSSIRQNAPVDLEAPEFIVERLKSGQVELQARAVQELRRLLEAPPVEAEAFLAYWGIEALATVIRSSLTNDQEELSRAALLCLHEITTKTAIATALEESSRQVLKLATSIIDGSGSSIDTIAAWIVCNLAASQFDAIQGEWFLPSTATALERMLQSPTPQVRSRTLYAMAFVGRCVTASASQFSAKKAFTSAAVTTLLPLMWSQFREGDTIIRSHSLSAVTNMMHQQQARSWLLNDVGIPTLLALLTSSSCEREAGLIALIIANLAMDEQTREAAVEHGALDLLTERIAANGVDANHLVALQNLVSSDISASAVYRHVACIEAVLRELSSGKGDVLALESSKMLLHLVTILPDSQWRDSILATAATRHRCDSVQEYCCWIVYTLASGNLEDEVIDSSVSLLHSVCGSAPAQPSLVEASAAAVGSLVSFMGLHKAMARKEALVSGLATALGFPPAKPYAIGALRLLAQLHPDLSAFVAKELSRLCP